MGNSLYLLLGRDATPLLTDTQPYSYIGEIDFVCAKSAIAHQGTDGGGTQNESPKTKYAMLATATIAMAGTATNAYPR
jgi:hypothetical protein